MEENVLNASESTDLVAGGIIGGIMATLGIFAFILAAVWYVLQVIAYWKIFTKAGKPGWHSLIPFLSNWDEIDLSWSRKWAWIWLALSIVTSIISSANQNAQNGDGSASGFMVSLAGILGIIVLVITIIGTYKLAKAFGKGFGFFLGLLLLNPIFKLILGFGSAQYQGRQG